MDQYQEDLGKVLDSPEGARVFQQLLGDLGYGQYCPNLEKFNLAHKIFLDIWAARPRVALTIYGNLMMDGYGKN